MKAIDSKILVVKEDQQDLELKEKLGGLEVPKGIGDYEAYRVKSVGERVTGEVNEDDLVLTYPNPGHKFKYNGEEFRVITSADILVVI